MSSHTLKWLVVCVVACLISSLGFTISAAQGVLFQQVKDEELRYYVAREESAPEHIKVELTRQREEIEAEGLHFKVGYTTALRRNLERIAGARPPEDLIKAAQKQASEAETPSRPPAAAVVKGEAKCIATAKDWDWRKARMVTSVRDQADCGSCWAFATAAAFESNFLIRTGAALTPDLSEQHIVSCSNEGTCNGGWWAFGFAVKTGVASELTVPYDAEDEPCLKDITISYRAAVWNYVDVNAPIPSVDKIKQALCEHGPLAAAVNATPRFQAYISGVFDENDLGRPNRPVNHAITIIGWDDNLKAWLIKNSWGLGWGNSCGYGRQRGYMWISYKSNNVGYGAAWVESQPGVIPGQPK
jgi:cathepsin L